MSIAQSDHSAHPSSSRTFGKNATEALADRQLHGALHRATSLFGERRGAAISTVDDWEGLRELASSIKDDTARHLDRYLEQFVAAAEAAGATVHWARDGAEACRIVGRIAEERGARKVVKSKSMVSEEIHLNPALMAEGLDVIETDLGEYIIQLAGETPSHIVAPAIHKTKGQIAALFEKALDMPPTEDVAVLTQTAREVLRRHFATADLGVSGVNFGVAETGSILILENEGNARLTTSLPRTHVALMGIEKLIPRFADLETFLRLLPRSGTGQQITAYQSIITGVKQSPDGEGPEELHIVLLDNGRTRMLAHPLTRQTLWCIRCGACLNVCPVYQQVGGHAYGSVYPGPIGAIVTPQLIGIEEAAQLPFASTLCGACRDVCPVRIDIPQILLHLRSKVVEEAPPSAARPTGERLSFRFYTMLMSRPRLLGWAARLGRVAQRAMLGKRTAIGEKAGVAGKVGPVGAWTGGRDMKTLAPKSFRDQWVESVGDRPSRGGQA
jgi:L-lactate dehydrogenase complex protein LldF